MGMPDQKAMPADILVALDHKDQREMREVTPVVEELQDIQVAKDR
jgi:hypothetical protein